MGQKIFKKTLTLMEDETDIPYFGKTFIFSMTCSSCKYHKSDVESAEKRDPSKYSLDITSEEDMNIRVVRGSDATVKVPRIGTIEPGESADGYVTNVQGVLERIKQQVEFLKEDSDDADIKKKARNMIKKINRMIFGQETGKLIIEDPSGNSAIISDKAVKKK